MGDCTSIGDLKKKTKAGTGCGGCMPLVRSNVFVKGILTDPTFFFFLGMTRLQTFSIPN